MGRNCDTAGSLVGTWGNPSPILGKGYNLRPRNHATLQEGRNGNIRARDVGIIMVPYTKFYKVTGLSGFHLKERNTMHHVSFLSFTTWCEQISSPFRTWTDKMPRKGQSGKVSLERVSTRQCPVEPCPALSCPETANRPYVFCNHLLLWEGIHRSKTYFW